MYCMHLVYNLIGPTDKVLDVGGWAQPFRRANCVIDFMPYETRNTPNTFLQNIPEFFDKKTWIIQDICDSSKPFPFKNKEFDFVVCGHILEDIRDPIFVIREMIRVGKQGYIETPSRFYEQLLGLQYRKMCGASHHRWIVALEANKDTGQNELVFLFKNHQIHSKKEYQVRKPRRCTSFPYLNPNYEVLGLFWKKHFRFYEDMQASIENKNDFLEDTVKLAKAIGSELWDQSQGIPVELRRNPIEKGIISLEQIDNLVTKRVRMYDSSRRRTKEIIDYEKNLIKR